MEGGALICVKVQKDHCGEKFIRSSQIQIVGSARRSGSGRSAFMKKNYIDITKRISDDLRKLRQDIPDTMKGFSALAQAAGRDGALDRKTKELIALAIAIATRCDGCIGFHMEALVRLGATRQEVEETLGMTIYMGGGPSLMYAADAISAFEEFQVQLGVAA
jgi:AhpD family alkylhydroperoxidase